MNKILLSVLMTTAGLGCVPSVENDQALGGTIGPAGGALIGAKGTAFEGVRVQIPAGALTRPTDISVVRAENEMALPATALRCGPMYALRPAGLTLHAPAAVTLPFDPDRRRGTVPFR